MTSENKAGGRVRFSCIAFVCLAWGLVACVAIQTFIAGLAVFTNPIHWFRHTVFVHIFEYLPLFMLLFAWIGKLPARMRWESGGLLLLIFSQYMTANLPGAGAMHPVVALIMFWLSIAVAKRSTRFIRRAAGSERNRA
ncbi:hypothetical protein PAE9249_04166 [Paenibacillus sp. CECT 9249]|uniref:DUF6220 domain-containing protein n=1 Tax=Paenibacillus sp. CECT 9249 TaxID=2845385 RepID=UPI001E486D31|nr:DUF6220 domain-containing protein [Paenibacillus sp. CECT 9249]CAH0121634.1 hypothetical protein PAE9249_04166 [Paenibacillus sp. CECT 9249]